MKSLSISTATFAVAVSLASTAQANETAPYIAPETDGLFESKAPATQQTAPVVAVQVNEPLGVTTEVPVALVDAAFSLEAPQGLRLPANSDLAAGISASDDRVVTTMSIDPRYGDIDAFWRDIIAFYGDIDAFWGDISPFYGDIDAFWGDISPFYGDIGAFWGDISPFYGDIGAFYGDIVAFEAHIKSLGTFWKSSGSLISQIDAKWTANQQTGAIGDAYKTIDEDLKKLRDSAVLQFGAAGFTKEMGDAIMARHGFSLKNHEAMRKMTAAERAAFFLDWHDSLMEYSGIDHVDHWMSTVNWTPSITQIQGEGKQTIIGFVDGSFAADSDLGDNIAWSGGGTNTVGGHGAGVASLVAGAHDGKGVMGIAPKVKIATYNPFDATGTSSWDDVAKGIESIMYAYVGGNETGYVSIINLSLGESGWALSQGMADVLARPNISAYSHETLYVMAAGNDGITQTTDITWDHSKGTSFILVGSVDPNGNISSFSNRPGSTCLVDQYGNCGAGNELYMRTVVAPGSMILVSDGQGGVTRVSGTSFAAPLVSGAVSLLHDRWPWLVKHPEESAEIIFRSAQDLGAPGPDEVYGWGLLDVAASQSPLNFNDLTVTTYQRVGTLWVPSVTSVTSLLTGGIPEWWETDDVFFTAQEKIGDTYRDFSIPMSSYTYGKSTNALGHGYQRLQDFISGRFANWLLSGGKDSDGDGKAGIAQIRSNMAETSGQWTMRYDAIAPNFGQDGALRPVHNAATLTDPSGAMSFTLGHGQGALALAGNSYGLMSDSDYEVGGVNPVLGFASGDLFAAASYMPAKATKLTVGFSQTREDWEDLQGVSELQRSIQRELGAREAEAMTVGIEQKVTDNVTLNAQWTRLTEKDALLGAQTSIAAFLGEGSQTDAVTMSANIDLGDGLSFDLSATAGGTEADEGQLLATSQRALSTAGQFSVNKRGVLGQRDILRVSVGQPLTIERGDLELRSEQVIDRETGELGIVTQTIGIETKRRYTGEFVYATPVTETSEFGLIGRYVSGGVEGQDPSFTIGANFGLRF
ncbi:S8 family peptidase [Erythrobacter sp. GH1-10]|uniref:S8 family peptidase n=1 Tax=Erythrobacter sp. GH1-10 TaxID=3349334 RepID=UPI003877AA25